jgi:hypothetical protein
LAHRLRNSQPVLAVALEVGAVRRPNGREGWQAVAR